MARRMLEPRALEDIARSRPEFAGMDDFYRNELEPAIREINRKAQLWERAFLWGLGGFFLLAFVFMGRLMAVNQALGGTVFGVGLAALIALGVISNRYLEQRKALVYELTLPLLGLTVERKPAAASIRPLLERFGQAKKGWRIEPAPRFTGAYRGAAFQVAQARARDQGRNRSRDGDHDAYLGAFVEVAAAFDIQGAVVLHSRSLAARLYGVHRAARGLEEMSEVNIPDPVFSKTYTLKTLDQVEARLVFDPIAIDRMAQIEKSFGAAGVMAIVEPNRLSLWLKGMLQRFELTTVHGMDDSFEMTFARFLEELGAIYDLIDAINPAARR